MLLIIAGIIYLITGRNRRQKEKIPDGMDILCDPPEQRYLVYAMGIFVFLGVMVISVLYIRAGAPKEARMMWGQRLNSYLVISGKADPCTVFPEMQIAFIVDKVDRFFYLLHQ